MASQIVVPAAAKSVITPVAQSTFQVGTYTPLTDAFTKVVDLNDHVSFWIDTVDLPQPSKVYARTSTIRSAGERITNWNYKNRQVTVTLRLLYQSGTTALLAAVRALLAAIETPPYRLAFAPPNASVLTYADVVAVKHTIPTDAKLILAGAISKVSISFECAPGFAGDRITLQNLVVNPGFEAPSGPPISVFNDNYTNTNAYTTLAGTAPTVTGGNGLNIPNGTTIAFGSPEWGAINQWTMRWQFFTGLGMRFHLHYTDANNNLCAVVTGTVLQLVQSIAGTAYNLGQVTIALTNTGIYWIVLAQFPSAPGMQPQVQAMLYNDNAGAIGTLNASIGPVATQDAVTALVGKPAIVAVGANGLLATTNKITLFGPGAWGFTGLNGTTGLCSGAWEQNTANTYSSGDATSYGALRMDCPPAGTVSAYWNNYLGGAPSSALGAIPAAAGQTLGVSVWLRSTGVSATMSQQLLLYEYDASGAQLRTNTLATKTGAQATWAQLSATLTLGASTAYVGLLLLAADATAGASANGTVWWDNCQVYNQTTTGQTAMPYCELRFPQSPAQLLLTGLQGDLPAPASLSLGIHLQTYSSYFTLSALVSQRAQPHRAGVLVYPPQVNGSPTGELYVLDATVWGGYYLLSQGSNGNTYTSPLATTENALTGAYHLMVAVKPGDNHYSLQTLQPFASEFLSDNLNGTVYAQFTGASVPLGATTAIWMRGDAGYVTIPIAPALGREDLSQKWIGLLTQVSVGTASSAANAFAKGPTTLQPIDGGFTSVTLGNMSSYENNDWLWIYNDPPATNVSPWVYGAHGGAWRFSLESAELPNAAHAVGGPGNGGLVTIQPLADPYLTLDPTNAAGATGGPISQMALTIADSANGYSYQTATDIQYIPMYLYPRQS